MRLLHVGLNADKSRPNGLQKAFDEKYECVHLSAAHPDINKTIAQYIYQFQPHIMWMQIQTPNIIANGTIKYAKLKKVFVMNWMGDIRLDFPEWLAEMGKHANLTACSNMNYVDELRSRKVTADYLQIGYDSGIYNPIGEKDDGGEIVFFGNNYKNHFPLSALREKMVNLLQLKYPGFGVYGRGWKDGNGDYMNNPQGEASIYRSCRIAINLSHFDYRRCSSSRLYRLMGSGAFCLTKHYPEIEKDFVDSKHLVVWHDLEDLVEKIDYYLSHEKERKEIAEVGCALAKNYYTYECMINNIHDLYLKYKL